jgi:hypothetical protein
MSDLWKQLGKIREQAEALRQQQTKGRQEGHSWLAFFEQLAAAGFAQHEPDFPQALAEYRVVVEKYGEDTRGREESWELHKARNRAWFWIIEMYDRVREGKPAVTLSEYESLADGFEEHQEELCSINPPSHTLDLGNGRQVCLADIANHLGNKGARALGTTEVVEKLRLLRAGYEQGTLRPASERTP